MEINITDPIIAKTDNGQKIAQSLFTMLEKELRKNPFEWDGWLYFNNFIDREYFKTYKNSFGQSSPIENPQRYALLKDKGYYLFDLLSFALTKLSSKEYIELKRILN